MGGITRRRHLNLETLANRLRRSARLRCAWAQLKCPGFELLFARIGGKGFHERLVRERRRARFVAMADERASPCMCGDVRCEALAERRLADPGLADEHDQLAMTCAGCVEA